MDPSDVTTILANAVKSVADANVPDELKTIAFEKAITLFAGSVAPVAAFPSSVGAAAGLAAAQPGGGSALDRLANRLRLGRDVVEAVYTENGDTLAVTVGPDRLAKAKSTAAREIALLVAAAHQSKSDEPTTSDEIRKEAEQYDRYDGPNFASTLADMKGTFLIAGTPRARTYYLTKPGWAAATTLIAKLGGPEKAAT